MRGNLRRIGVEMMVDGSIPAYAGEPGRRPAPLDGDAVYPRVCGGTRNDGLLLS